jgi:hypothetical protein
VELVSGTQDSDEDNMAQIQNPTYEDQFYGMDRRLDPDKLGDGYSPLAVNVDLDRLGSVRKRKGTSLLGETGIPDSQVQSLVQYVNSTGATEYHMIRNGALYKYNEQLNTWDNLIGGQFSSLSQVQSVTFKNRVYHVSAKETLKWNVGDNVMNEVGTGTNAIMASCLAVGQRTLFIGNVTVNNVRYPDRVYYSLFDTENIQEGDQFWNDEETGLADSTRYFRVEGGVVQAIVPFASSNSVYIFSDSKCYYFNINEVETNPFGALVEVFPIGCAGPRAATVVDGVMYFMDKQGKIWAWSGSTSRPEELSYSIDDGSLGDSVISQINTSQENISKVCAFNFGKKIYFSVGDLALDKQVLANACIKFSASQNGLRANFSIDTFPDRILNACIFNLSSGLALVAGNSANVLIMNNGLNDIDQNNTEVAVNMYYRTKEYHFGFPFQSKQIQGMLVKFKPQSAPGTYMEVSMATNGQTEYTPITSPNTVIKTHGSIDMYSLAYETQRQRTAKIKLPVQDKALTYSFEFANRQLNQTMELQAFGFDSYTVNNPNINLKS